MCATLPPPVIYVITSNDSAVRAVMDPRNEGARSSALKFHRSLTEFFATHGQTRLVLVWSPTDRSLDQRKRARALLSRAVATFPRDEEMCSPDEAFLRRDMRQAAFDQWDSEWIAHPPHEASMSAVSFPNPPSSANNHPLWSAVVKEPEKPKALLAKAPLLSSRRCGSRGSLSITVIRPLPALGLWSATPSLATTPAASIPLSLSTTTAALVALSSALHPTSCMYAHASRWHVGNVVSLRGPGVVARWSSSSPLPSPS